MYLKILTIFAAVVVSVGAIWHFRFDEAKAPEQTLVKADKVSKYQIDKADSLAVVVNKGRMLPADYVPKDLVSPQMALVVSANDEKMQLRLEAALALGSLNQAARNEGFELRLNNGYRSFATQSTLYNSYVALDGQAEADKTSARPGHSEHQTGLAADLEPLSGECSIQECFGETPEGIWLAKNAHAFGFIIRYLKDKTIITGYSYEPWHLRYVGKELANELYKKNLTLEENFSLVPMTTYPAQPTVLK